MHNLERKELWVLNTPCQFQDLYINPIGLNGWKAFQNISSKKIIQKNNIEEKSNKYVKKNCKAVIVWQFLNVLLPLKTFVCTMAVCMHESIPPFVYVLLKLILMLCMVAYDIFAISHWKEFTLFTFDNFCMFLLQLTTVLLNYWNGQPLNAHWQMTNDFFAYALLQSLL